VVDPAGDPCRDFGADTRPGVGLERNVPAAERVLSLLREVPGANRWLSKACCCAIPRLAIKSSLDVRSVIKAARIHVL
jgi:hypothetical protein